MDTNRHEQQAAQRREKHKMNLENSFAPLVRFCGRFDSRSFAFVHGQVLRA
jgi:hypothetical protein